MNDQSARLARAISGPVILITIGVLFAFDRYTEFRFTQTWPVLLIVLGLLKLLGGSDRRFRRDGPSPPPPNPGGPGARP